MGEPGISGMRRTDRMKRAGRMLEKYGHEVNREVGKPDGIALCFCTVKLILGWERGAERILLRHHRRWEKVKLSSGGGRREDYTLVETIAVPGFTQWNNRARFMSTLNGDLREKRRSWVCLPLLSGILHEQESWVCSWVTSYNLHLKIPHIHFHTSKQCWTFPRVCLDDLSKSDGSKMEHIYSLKYLLSIYNMLGLSPNLFNIGFNTGCPDVLGARDKIRKWALSRSLQV